MSFIDSDDLEDVAAVVPGAALPGLAGHIRQKFTASEEGRRSDEQRWLKSYENYRVYLQNQKHIVNQKDLKLLLK